MCSKSLPLMLGLVATSAALASAASATTFIDVTLEDLARSSDVIVTGRVTAADPQPHGPNALPGIHTRVQLAVDEWLAGDDGSRLVTFWVHGGRLGDRMRVVPGQARFHVGEQVAVFLFRSDHGALWPTGMGRGKWRVSGGVADASPRTALEQGGALVTSVPAHELRARVLRARGAP